MVRYRYLFSQLARRELRKKYKGSAFGVLWYLVNPIVLMGAYWFMFGVIYQKQEVHDYPIFLMVGIVVWTFFQQSLLSAAPSLLDQSGLVRKARFPREAIPAATVKVQLVIFSAVLLLFLPVAVAIRGTLTPALLLLPVLIALLYGFVLGCSMIAAILGIVLLLPLALGKHGGMLPMVGGALAARYRRRQDGGRAGMAGRRWNQASGRRRRPIPG